MGPKVWTTRRKWLGNLIPAIVWIIFTVPGVFICARSGNFTGLGLRAIVLGLVLAILVLNYFGFFENSRMRRELEAILSDRQAQPKGNRYFVGYASPSYSSAIDPHEDVGFLILAKDQLIFVSEMRCFEIPKKGIVKVRFRPNVHSVFLFGRWISIETVDSRFFFEPRERRSLLGNRRVSKKLAKEIREWL